MNEHRPTTPRYRFEVHLKDREDAGGLARLLEDVLLPDVAGLADFTSDLPEDSPHADASPADGSADVKERFLILDEDQKTEALVAGYPGTVLLAVRDQASVEQYAALDNVIPFRASNPLEIAAEVMDRFSGADAPVQLFDPGEATRMRSLASEFPTPLEPEDERDEDPYARGQRYWHEGRLTDALAAFAEALALDPERAEIHVARGQVLEDLAWEQDAGRSPGDPSDSLEESRSAYRAALATGYHDPGELGFSLFDLEDYEGAVEALETAVKRTDSAPLRTSLGSAVALLEGDADRFKRAEAEYTRALELDAQNVGAARSRAVVRVSLCDYEGALEDSMTAERLGESAAGLFFYRALIYLGLGDLSQARMCAERAVSTAGPDDRKGWFHFVNAHVCAELADLDEAYEHFQAAEKLAQEADDEDLRAQAKGSEGLVLARMGRLDDARRACESSLARAPTAPEPHATLAWLHLHGERREDARAMIDRAIELIESSPVWRRGCQYQGTKWPFYVMQAAIHNSIAEHYDDLDSAETALVALARAQKDRDKLGERRRSSDPEAAQVFVERARSHAIMGNQQLVAVDLRECLKLAPQTSRARYIATRALRYAPSRSLQIDPRLIIAGELLLLAGAVALFLRSNLGSGAFATLVIGVIALGLVAYALPVVTEIRVGTFQLQKEVTAAGPPPLPQLDTPIPKVPFVRPTLRPSLPSVRSYFRKPRAGG